MKKQVSAFILALDTDPIKWLPVINEVLDGEPLDLFSANDQKLIDIEQQNIQNNEISTALYALENGLKFLLLEQAIEDSESLVRRMSVVDELVTRAAHALINEQEAPERHAAIDRIIREAGLTSADAKTARVLCDKFIEMMVED